jgi:cysteine desulfurase
MNFSPGRRRRNLLINSDPGGSGKLKELTYLDNLTVTPLLDEAGEAVLEAFRHGYGHPRSTNIPGRLAQRALEDLKDRTARYFGGSEVKFFYDGDLANSHSILSAGRLARESGRWHIVTSPIERSPVVTALKMLVNEGSTISILDTDKFGKVLPESLSKALSDITGLVTCTWANGISGTVQPVPELAGIAHERGAIFHTDACHAAGRINIDLSDTDVDIITLCSVKIGGPPGAAAVVMKNKDTWLMSAAPELSCITNIPGISGMVAAIDVLDTGIEPRSRIVNELRRDILAGLDKLKVRYSVIGGGFENILPGTALLNIKHAPGRLHLKLENDNVILPSHNSTDRLSYLNSTGQDIANPDRYLGFSLDTRNTAVDIEHFLRVFTEIVMAARGA